MAFYPVIQQLWLVCSRQALGPTQDPSLEIKIGTSLILAKCICFFSFLSLFLSSSLPPFLTCLINELRQLWLSICSVL